MSVLCCCRFDAVVLATHSDISLSLLGAGATEEERAVLKAIPYNNNDIYLHTDEALMPVSHLRLDQNDRFHAIHAQLAPLMASLVCRA